VARLSQTRCTSSPAGTFLSILWGSITGSRLDGLPGWDHRRVIISVIYLLVRCLLDCLTVVSRGLLGFHNSVHAYELHFTAGNDGHAARSYSWINRRGPRGVPADRPCPCCAASGVPSMLVPSRVAGEPGEGTTTCATAAPDSAGRGSGRARCLTFPRGQPYRRTEVIPVPELKATITITRRHGPPGDARRRRPPTDGSPRGAHRHGGNGGPDPGGPGPCSAGVSGEAAGDGIPGLGARNALEPWFSSRPRAT